MNIDESRLEGLPDEARERVRGAKSADELLAIAADAGVELADDDLEGISGGYFHPTPGGADPKGECPPWHYRS